MIEYVAQVEKVKNCPTGSNDTDCVGVLPQVSASEDAFSSALSIVFGLFAAVAILVIIIAAINFATADGDSEKVGRAKKTIIYALVGLVISLSAEAVVLFLIGRL